MNYRVFIRMTVEVLLILRKIPMKNQTFEQRNNFDCKVWLFMIFFFSISCTFQNIISKTSIYSHEIKVWSVFCVYLQIRADEYCWTCHLLEPTLFCTECIRSFHTSPACSGSPPNKMSADEVARWKCPECINIHIDETKQKCVDFFLIFRHISSFFLNKNVQIVIESSFKRKFLYFAEISTWFTWIMCWNSFPIC